VIDTCNANYRSGLSLTKPHVWLMLPLYQLICSSFCFSKHNTLLFISCGLICITLLVRYHLDEDPKALRVLAIPLHDSKGSVCQYDHMNISPDGKLLAVTSGSTLQWLCVETGAVLDTAEKAHEGL
jgi:hypothetical protein